MLWNTLARALGRVPLPTVETHTGRVLSRLVPRRQPAPCVSVSASSGLRSLTAAALALPGLSIQAAHAASVDDSVSLQYGYYKQSQWQLLDGLKTQYSPLQVENISGSGLLNFADRWTLGFNYAQDTWSGATPVASAPNALGGNNPSAAGASPLILGNGSMLYDKRLNAYQLNTETASYVKDNRLVQTVASASPEIRNQGDFRLGYEWDEAAFNLNGGVSQEPDYNSAFGGFNGRMDFNQKLTTANLGLNYNNSDISALINPTFAPYVDYGYYANKGQIRTNTSASGIQTQTITGNRQDWSSHLSVAQVVNKDLMVESGIGYIRSTGYLANPYKAVDMVFVNFNGTPVDTEQPGLPSLYQSTVQGVMERRPELRNQGIWDIRMVQYVEGLDASFHAGYRFFHDDWGITAHTFDLDWVQPLMDQWTVTPRFRYYSQDAASFYQPYFLMPTAAPTTASGSFNLAAVPLKAYSSDYRLSAYGAISTGLTVTKQLGKALGFEAGFEYYTHGGNLMMGNSGQGSWANFDYFQYNAALKLEPSVVTMTDWDDSEEHSEHAHHAQTDHEQTHLGMDAPAGVLFAHTLAHEGDVHVGVRYQYASQSGQMMHSTRRISDQQIVASGCGAVRCTYAPKDMNMGMYMVDLMYAPTDWLTLMLMPQFMSMDMHLRRLDGAPPPSPSDAHAAHGANPYHQSAGLGDIDMSALVKLYEAPGHKIHISLGFTAPTGSVNQRINGNTEFEHYGMQLGAGTWNFWPSLTYNGFVGDYYWGGQLSTVAVLQNYNDSGFANGNLFQSTAWGGYKFMDWLKGSLRMVYTLQDSIDGAYPKPFAPSGPMDMPQSYGGQFIDVGFGLNASVPSGNFAGNHFGLEWVQPAYNDYNGAQLSRTGSLWASWSLAF